MPNTKILGSYADTANNEVVSTVGNQTIAGVKSFTGNVCIGTTAAYGLPFSVQNSTVRLETGEVSGETYFESLNNARTSTVPTRLYGSEIKAFTGASGSYAERARIDSSGNFLVGTTNPSGAIGNGFKVSGASLGLVQTISSSGLADTYNYYNSTAAAYRFYVTSGGTIYATNTTISAISDVRHKENIRDLDVGLNEILALKPRTFDWKEGKGKDIKNDRGFIAQEFEEVFPNLIDAWKDPAPEGEEPYKSVRQDLFPVLVKAIQELKAELDAAKAEIQALKQS